MLSGDLRQAVIRRMPRRLLVDLPDVANRAKIAEVWYYRLCQGKSKHAIVWSLGSRF